MDVDVGAGAPRRPGGNGGGGGMDDDDEDDAERETGTEAGVDDGAE